MSKLGTVLGAAAALLCTPAMADTKSSNHTLDFGPDIWRIELRNADQLRQIVGGDEFLQSEIRYVAWSLISGDQFHMSTISAEELQPITSGTQNKGSYISLYNGASIGARIPDVTKGTQLWVHAQQYDGDGGKPKLQFQLETRARDLDCVGTRVCRRGDTGYQRIVVELDIPPVRSFECSDQNTLRMGVIANGVNSWLPVMHPEGKREAKSVAGQRAAQPHWGGVLRLTGTHRSNGPILTPVLNSLDDVTICIASSTRN